MSSTPGDRGARSKPRVLAPSMKARREIFDDEALPSNVQSRARPFSEHLKDAAAAELPSAVKLGLYALGALVVVLLLWSLVRMVQPRKPKAADSTACVERVDQTMWKTASSRV